MGGEIWLYMVSQSDSHGQKKKKNTYFLSFMSEQMNVNGSILAHFCRVISTKLIN